MRAGPKNSVFGAGMCGGFRIFSVFAELFAVKKFLLPFEQGIIYKIDRLILKFPPKGMGFQPS